MINPVGNSSPYTNYPNKDKRSEKEVTGNAPPISPQTGINVEISDEAKRFMNNEFKEYAEHGFLKFDKDFMSHEAATLRKMQLAEQLRQPAVIQSIETDVRLGIKYDFSPNSLEGYIASALNGKVQNSYVVANELGQMIRGAAYDRNNSTIDERAVRRETALLNAQYIADQYLHNPDEAKAFLKKVQEAADNDILREKGYVVIEGSGIEPFRNYTMPGAPEGYVNTSALLKKYDPNLSMRELMENPSKYNAFASEAQKYEQQWAAETILSFEQNAANVDGIIKQVKDTFDRSLAEENIQRLIAAL